MKQRIDCIDRMKGYVNFIASHEDIQYGVL